MPDLPTTAGSYAPTISSGVTLSANLSIGDKNGMHVSDTSACQRGGGLVKVESEVIYYGMYDPSEPGMIYDLYRAQNGTTEADHVSGAAVTVYGYAKGMAAMQAHMLNLEARVKALEP